MKKLLVIAILLNNWIVSSQDTTFNKDFFKIKLTNSKINHQNFADFEVLPLFKQLKGHEQSVLLTKPSKVDNQYNRVQPINYKMKKIPYSINYEQDFRQCGPLQLRDSEDMMVGAIIDYVFNKYVVGLFLPTPYDD